MQTPLLLTAFGTTSAAQATYRHIEKEIQEKFTDRDIYWGYSSRVVARELRKNQAIKIQHPTEILNELAIQGYTEVTVQSLHLLPGHEFHTLQREVNGLNHITCRMGLPLLSSENDYHSVIDLLAPTIQQDTTCAVLVVGHGTRHPVWPAYLALENLLKKRFGERLFTGVVEHSPDSSHIEDSIIAGGYEKVLLIPLFLVAGMHYRRDMIGDSSTSWKSRLQVKGLDVESVPDGIGMLPGISDIVIRHIVAAEEGC